MQKKITLYQFFAIVFATIVSVSCFTLPTFLLKYGGHDFFICLIIGGSIDILIGYILYRLGMKHGGKNIYQYNRQICGKTVGTTLNILLMLAFAEAAVITAALYSNFMSSVILPGTPTYVFSLFLLATCTYGLIKGITVLGRMSEGIYVILIVPNIAFAVLSLPDFTLREITPVLVTHFKDILHGSLFVASWFGTCTLMGILFPITQSHEKIFKVKFAAVTLGVSLMCVIFTFAIGVFGLEPAKKLVFPIHSLAQMASLGQFIAHIESLSMVVWSLGCFLSITMLLYSTLEGLKSIVPEVKPVILNTLIPCMVFVMSLLQFKGTIDIYEFIENVYLWLGFAVYVTIPGLVYAIDFVKNRIKRQT